MFKFLPDVSKNFNKCLISNQITKIFIKTYGKYFPSSKF